MIGLEQFAVRSESRFIRAPVSRIRGGASFGLNMQWDYLKLASRSTGFLKLMN